MNIATTFPPTQLIKVSDSPHSLPSHYFVHLYHPYTVGQVITINFYNAVFTYLVLNIDPLVVMDHTGQITQLA